MGIWAPAHDKEDLALVLFLFVCLFACFVWLGFFDISWATLEACGGSQARGLIRAVAASLCQSHSNA